MSRPREGLSSLLLAPGLAAGVVVLAARPVATYQALLITLVTGVIAAAVPLPSGRGRGASVARWLAVTGSGVAAFAVARAATPPLLATVWLPGIVASLAAGVAEEAFFRRALYGWPARWGAGAAIAIAAALFAAVHVPVYGWSIIPVDLAAGALFGWQRWATGGWSAPAVTHAAANLLQLR